MANYNIFFSPTGGTRKVADILAGNLEGNFTEIDLCKDIAPVSLKENDICIVSVPSYGGRVPAIAIERLGKIAANGARAVLNCVYGNREWEDTLTELQDTLVAIGMRCVCAVAAVAEHSVFRMFANGRPDEQDIIELRGFAKQIQERLNCNEAGSLNLSGSHYVYKEYGGIPFKPVANETCTGCGLCAAECPVGAIDPCNPKTTCTSRCISCMRCVGLCPVHARDFDKAMMEAAAAKMAHKLGGRKGNWLFL